MRKIFKLNFSYFVHGKMDIKTRNKLNVISRWKKLQYNEQEYIECTGKHYQHLKARILGYLAGDGNIYIGKTSKNRHHSIRFFPDHSSLLKPYCEAFSKVYNKTPIIKPLSNKYCVTVDSKIVVLNMTSSASFGLFNWEVPIIFLKDKRSKKEWLRAFFDAEAYVGKNHIKIQTVNEKGMGQMKRLLEEFGIESKKYVYIPKNIKWSPNHIIFINKKSSRYKYFKEIGFSHILKQKKLIQALNL